MNRKNRILYVAYAMSPWLSMSKRAPRQGMSCSLGSLSYGLLFGLEKVMEIILVEECEAYSGWMIQFRQVRPNFCHLGLRECLLKSRKN